MPGARRSDEDVSRPVEIVCPVAFTPHWEKLRVVWTSIVFTEVDALHAPIVARANLTRHRHHGAETEAVEFRCFQGQIYHKINEFEYGAERRPPLRQEPTDPPTEDLRVEDPDGLDWFLVGNPNADRNDPLIWHPVNRSRFRYRYERLWTHPEEGEENDRDAAIASAQMAADQVIVIGEDAWAPGAEPCYSMMWFVEDKLDNSIRLEFVHPEDRGQFQRRRDNLFSPNEEAFARDVIAQITGRNVIVKDDHKIEICDPSAFSATYDALSAEATAWNVIWKMRRVTIDHDDRDAIRAYAHLRDALEKRWPRMSIDFGQGREDKIWPHHPDFEPPAASTELLDALEAVHLAPYWTRHAWYLDDIGLAVARHRRRDILLPEADQEALEFI